MEWEREEAEENLYLYKAKCLRVIDGDTLELDIDLGLHAHIIEKVRLQGIDTPETYGVKKGSPEYLEGKKATNRVIELVLPEGRPKQLWIRTHKDKQGKYGRYVVELWLYIPCEHPDDPEQKHEEFSCLNTVLVEEGLAVQKDY